MPVCEQLHLHVSRALEEALAEDRAVAEGRLRLASSARQCILEVVRGADDAHAAATPAGCRLDEQREADVRGVALRQHRHAGLRGDALRGKLVAAEAECIGGRPDPRQPGGLHRGGEVGALGEEAVPGMDGVGAGLPRGAHVLGGVEIGRDLDGRICRTAVSRAAVVRGDDGHRPDAEPPAGAKHAQGDLPSVGDEHAANRHPGGSLRFPGATRRTNTARRRRIIDIRWGDQPATRTASGESEENGRAVRLSDHRRRGGGGGRGEAREPEATGLRRVAG